MWFGRHRVPAGVGLTTSGSVVTIGAYDGLHIGHEAILSRLKELGRELGARTVVMSFEPTPKEFFAGSNGTERLMSFRQRYVRLAELGIDLFYCPRFDARLSQESAERFARHWLADVLHARHIVVGDDFRYAREREGTFETLGRAGRELGFAVERTESVCIDGERISSTAIRRALTAGDLATANRFLGRPFALVGRVVRGKELGRTLGYPTANVRLRRRLVPRHGIYAVTVSGGGLERQPGVASLGTRPTVDTAGEVLLEVNVFDSAPNLYGKRIDVELHHYIRSEQKFASLDDLVAQMHDDAATARRLLA